MPQSHIDQVARARRAWPHLVRTARNSDRITYGTLTAKLGLHHRAASWLLGVIQDYCERHQLPALQAVAVNKRTKVPGSGYVASPRGGSAYRRELDRVYGAAWPLRAPF